MYIRMGYASRLETADVMYGTDPDLLSIIYILRQFITHYKQDSYWIY